MADLQPYRFEPERVPHPEDSESQNEDVNDRLEGTFLVFLWVMSNHANAAEGNVFAAVNSQRKKTKLKVEFKAYSASVAVNGKLNDFFCKLL